MYLPTELENPVTGEQIVFDETASDDERLVWDEFRPANVEPPPAHYHPNTEERFDVRAGRLVVEIDGDVRQVGADEGVVIPPGTPHVSYTKMESARFRREVAPPARWRELLTDRFAAAHATGERSSVRRLLRNALLLRAYPDVIVPARPPQPVQSVLIPVLAAVARTVGVRSRYPYPREESSARRDRERTA